MVCISTSIHAHDNSIIPPGAVLGLQMDNCIYVHSAVVNHSASALFRVIVQSSLYYFTRRASKRRCVLFAAVWREPGVIMRRVLFAAGWREPGVVCYHI